MVRIKLSKWLYNRAKLGESSGMRPGTLLLLLARLASLELGWEWRLVPRPRSGMVALRWEVGWDCWLISSCCCLIKRSSAWVKFPSEVSVSGTEPAADMDLPVQVGLPQPIYGRRVISCGDRSFPPRSYGPLRCGAVIGLGNRPESSELLDDDRTV